MSYRHSSYRKVKRALAKLQEPDRRDPDGQRTLTSDDVQRLTWPELARVESREWGAPR